MNSEQSNTQEALLPPLSAKELEVLWLYDCKFSDQKISNLLFLKEHEFLNIKSKLYQTFDASDISTLLQSAIHAGYVHKI